MADNIYLNLSINNPIVGDVDFPTNKLAVYDESLAVPFLKKPSEYYASILRFSLPIDSVPLLLFPLNPLQNDPLTSRLVIGVQTTPIATNQPPAFPARQYVKYVPQSVNLPSPAPGIGPVYFTISQVQDQFYFIYSVDSFLSMINTALGLAFVGAGSPGGGAAPYYVYDSSTQLISLIVTAAFIGSGASIFMNAPMRVYLDSFRFKSSGETSTTSSIYYHDLSVLPYGGVSPYRFVEEYNAMDLWLDARKLVCISNSLPFQPEFNPVLTPSANTNPSSAQLPILTDFILAFDNIADVSSIITYVPDAQYRLCDLNSDSPINRINLQFYWVSENGNLFPIYLTPSQGATIKLGFLHKDLYRK